VKKSKKRKFFDFFSIFENFIFAISWFFKIFARIYFRELLLSKTFVKMANIWETREN